jgi:hypothetical protein
LQQAGPWAGAGVERDEARGQTAAGVGASPPAMARSWISANVTPAAAAARPGLEPGTPRFSVSEADEEDCCDLQGLA